MASNRNLFYFPVIAGIFLVAILASHVQMSQRAFEQYHHGLSDQMMQDVKHQVEAILSQYQRAVDIYVHGNTKLINQISESPDDEALQQLIESDLKQYFPDYLAYTITNDSGDRLIDPFMEKVGELCQRDIDAALHKNKSPVFVHPGPVHPHIDFVSRWLSADKERGGVFLISMNTRIFVDVLRAKQPEGHDFYLLRNDVDGLIEVSSRGIRRELSRNVKIQEEEKRYLIRGSIIDNTAWTVVDLADKRFINNNHSRLIKNAVIVLVVYVLMAAIIALFGHKEYRRRRKAEEELEEVRGFIPVCSYCHQIRTEDGDWEKLEEYLSHHTRDSKVTHGICPDCYESQIRQ